MGIPAFFRWLCDRFPKVIIDVIEEQSVSMEGVEVPIDTSRPNPNNMEFDNLYLDMNNIIHACTHPTNKPAPESEEEMMVEVSKFIDRLFSMVRPRKFLYMAIDGVAPRAKMNQQRSRRFRTAKEAKKTALIEADIRRKLIEEGKEVPSEDTNKKPKFDSNCITPGTPFMDRVAKYLEYYIADRCSNNAGWKNVKVLLSDSNTPGEGEHKIVHWIRQQRSQPNYDPNTRHAFYGLDADLIMLALATHEVNFYILREVVFLNKNGGGRNDNCFKCGQPGHIASQCPNESAPPPQPEEPDPNDKQPYQFVVIAALREYLNHILFVPNLPFEYDLERVLDDFVFLCFFVGNDFLPHLPTLEIRENAIGILVDLYKKLLPTCGYLTKDGEINLDRVEILLKEVGYLENGILVARLEKEKRIKENAKRRKESEARRFQQQYIKQKEEEDEELSRLRNNAAADRLRKSLLGNSNINNSLNNQNQQSEEQDSERPVKKIKVVETKTNTFVKKEEAEDEEEDIDTIKLGEEGWRERYYLSKFKASMNDSEFFKTITNEYIRGLAWVLKYYYSGCPSWGWYYPYHFAPFSGELQDLKHVNLDFELGQPFRPFEQLMAVLPPASAMHVPKAFQQLMTDPNSPILEFYPEDFEMDKNGKRQEWLHIALLPFIDENLLFKALAPLRNKLTQEEATRNEPREELLFVNSKHVLANTFINLVTSNNTNWTTINTSGIVGLLKSSKLCILPGKTIQSPYPDYLPNLQYSSVASIHFKLDLVATITRGLLPGLVMPPSILTNEDLETDRRSHNRNYYNNQNSAANRIVNHYTDNNQYKSHHNKMTHANSDDRHNNNYKPYSKDRRDNRYQNRDRDDYDNSNRHHQRHDNRHYRDRDDNYNRSNYRDDNRQQQYDNNRQYDNQRQDSRGSHHNRGGRGGGRGGYQHNNNNRGGYQPPYQQQQNSYQQPNNYQQPYQQQQYGQHPAQVWVPIQRPNVQVPPPMPTQPNQLPYNYPQNNWNNNNQ